MSILETTPATESGPVVATGFLSSIWQCLVRFDEAVHFNPQTELDRRVQQIADEIRELRRDNGRTRGVRRERQFSPEA